ncbi:MAG: hypothetical protein EOM52_10785 [Clostridia bacterium]|nr:hypothetical protein [Clostridia bacterium]
MTDPFAILAIGKLKNSFFDSLQRVPDRFGRSLFACFRIGWDGVHHAILMSLGGISLKCLCCMRNAARKKWMRVHLVDKCLLVILAILMLQSALNLFWVEANNRETNGIDIVIRTSAAAIFGYLISANFNQQKKRRSKQQNSTQNMVNTTAGSTQTGTQGRIGFDTGGGSGELGSAAPPLLTQAEENANCDRAQIIVVAAVCVLSLVVLVVYRNFFHATTASTGTLTQFRDFVSSSVGFLISCSTSAAGAGKE